MAKRIGTCGTLLAEALDTIQKQAKELGLADEALNGKIMRLGDQAKRDIHVFRLPEAEVLKKLENEAGATGSERYAPQGVCAEQSRYIQ